MVPTIAIRYWLSAAERISASSPPRLFGISEYRRPAGRVTAFYLKAVVELEWV
jgi:hypothetical protein